MNRKFEAYVSGIAGLEALLRGLSKEQLSFRPGEDKWSITEVAAHLADTEIQAYSRLRAIVADDVPFLVNHNEAKWTTAFKHSEIDPEESVALFKMIRNLNYKLIVSLTEAQLKMEGLHSTRGRMTVESLIKAHIVHLEKHLGQIERNLQGFQNQARA